MSTTMERLRTSLQSKYGILSVMSPKEMVDKGTVSSGSLAIDYMVSSKRGFGVPRDIVIEIGGAPGVGKSTLSFNLLNNVLDFEYKRALMKMRLKKAIDDGVLDKNEMDWFESFWEKQPADLHVFGEDEKNKILDEYELSESDKQYAIDNFMRNALYCDIEGRFDQHWASNFIDKKWLDNDKVLVTRPDTIENATTMYVDAVRTNSFAVAVIDSVGGAPTSKIFDKDAESQGFGGNSVGVTRFAQFAQNMASKFTCLTIGLQQVRQDMSGYHQYIVPGGVAWKHACSLRIELRRRAKEVLYDIEPGTTDSWVQCGFKVSARLHKNSIGPSGREASSWFYTMPCKYGDPGFDELQDLVNLCVLTGKIEKGASGVYRSSLFPNGKIRGWDSMISFVKENDDVRNEIKASMISALQNDGVNGYIKVFDDGEETNDNS